MPTTFASFGIKETLLQVLQKAKFTEPSSIQEQVIPVILDGKNVLAESPTGTGKTLAYLLPLCQKLEPEKKELQVLVLAPTHELVMQIQREAEKLLEPMGLHSVAVIGGVDPKRQLEKLKTHPVLIVATPGRIKELLDQRKLKVHTVKTLVVDEADRLVDQGFAGVVADVNKRLMRDTQRLFFSATLPKQVLSYLRDMVQEPVMFHVEKEESERVLHMYIVSELRKKIDTLRRLIRLVNAKRTIVFINHLDRVEEIQERLAYHQIDCRFIHRDTGKEERSKTIQDFRDGKFPVLVATDIAARGIDIPEVEAIIHLDPAVDADAYIHRSGRTGRMGAAGLVFSIIAPNQRFILEKFQKQTNIPIVERIMSYGALVDPEEKRRTPQNTGKSAKPAKKKQRK
ncbi:DEAD/DEAH box helicase [Brevibacillus sp. SYSU BS000544]|uniref:DEAD/DEAH box helicase n=1 Tax=Brevibacillus sp. SYSU BS000544 TaxID=3416443 RepID=UPI003CE477E1